MREFRQMADDILERALNVSALDVDRLLADWRWLSSEKFSLIARNAFGDLFLLDATGKVFWLDVAVGELSAVASSIDQFLESIRLPSNREEWLAESDARAFAQQGLMPSETQCIGFKMPLIFSESRDMPDNAYVANLYEQVSFLGDLNRQISRYPDGKKIELVIQHPRAPGPV